MLTETAMLSQLAASIVKLIREFPEEFRLEILNCFCSECGADDYSCRCSIS